MQQLAEGTRRRNKRTGEVQVLKGGQWMSEGGGSSAPRLVPLAPPDPYKVQSQQQDLTKGGLDIENTRLGIESRKLDIEKTRLDMERGDKDKEAQQTAKQAAGFYRRALNAHSGYGEGIPARPPIIEEAVELLPDSVERKFASDKRKNAETYAAEFIAATLRKESGAAITPQEFESQFTRYFPQSGDGPEQIEIKRQLREQAIEAIRDQAGDLVKAPEFGQSEAPITGHDHEEMSVATGETRTENNPAMVGVNKRVGELLSQGKGDGEILQFLKSVGADNAALLDIRRQLFDYRKFKRDAEKQGKTVGLPTIDFEKWEVPNSALNQISASPAGAYAVSAADTVTGGHLDNVVGLAGGNPELANIGIEQMRQQNPVSSFAGDVTGGAMLYATGRGALGLAGKGGAPATGTFARNALAGDAAMGGYIGSGQGGTDVVSGQNALLGAAAGVAGGAAGRGAINTTARTLSPSGGSLAPAYAEGVRPTVGQRMGGVADRAEQAFASVPLVGGIQRSARNNAVQDWQAGAFNQALREVGDGLPKGVKSGTQAHAYMQQSFNRAYDKARSGLQFARDAEFDADFKGVAQEVALLSKDSQNAFRVMVEEVSNRLNVRGGNLNGGDYKTLVSRIESKARKLRKNPQGDHELADAMEGLSLALDQGARRHSNPRAVAALDAADRGYVMAVLIEEAGRKAGGGEVGEFTGKQLEAAIRGNSGRRSRQMLRGEAPLQKYAAAGSRLGDSVPDSGTPERILTLGGMASLAHFIDPSMLAPWLADTLANLPGGKQAINALISPNRKALDPARRKLMERAWLGGLLAAPASEAAAK